MITLEKKDNMGIEKLKKRIEKELGELRSNGFISEAKKINAKMLKTLDVNPADRISKVFELVQIDKKAFESVDALSKIRKHLVYQSDLPIHFTGDLDSDVVYVGLNPRPGDLEFDCVEGYIKYAKSKSPHFYDEKICDFESYKSFSKNFALCKVNNHYCGKDSVPKNKFDGKQLAFFSGFNGKLYDDSIYKVKELVKLRENRLQMELIPYPSLAFDFKNYEDILEGYLEDLFEIIKSRKREYVFFSGEILKAMSKIEGLTIERILDVEKYHIPKTKSKLTFQVIKTNKTDDIKICIAQSFPMQSLVGEQMFEYGRKCKELYNSIN